MGRDGASEQRSWARALTASALAASRHRDPVAVVKATFPDDRRAVQILLRTPQVATGTGDFPTYDPVSVFSSLAPGSAAAQLFARSVKLDLAGISTIRIPLVSSMPPTTIFVGQDAPAPAVQFSLASTVLGPIRKMLVLSAVSSEVEMATPGTASAVIGRVLSDSTSRNLDLVAFGSAPGDAVSPPGLLHGVSPLNGSRRRPGRTGGRFGGLGGGNRRSRARSEQHRVRGRCAGGDPHQVQGRAEVRRLGPGQPWDGSKDRRGIQHGRGLRRHERPA
jgi:hypothetical protein